MTDFLRVADVLDNLNLKDSMLAAEFGCGSALLSIALAKKLNKGRVYALDIQEERLSALRAKANHENIKNILAVLCDLEAQKGSTLQNATLDVVLITNVLFQAENKYTIIEEAVRISKQGAQILIVDWLKKGPFSPKEGMIAPEEVKKMAEKLGLLLKKEFAIGDYHYGLLFVK